MPAAQTDKMVAMQSVAIIPLPPVASTALPSQPLPINNLERMKMVVILIPPSMAPAPNMDWLERMHNATIPHAPSSRMEMMDAQPQPLLNTDHPQQCTSTKVAVSQRQPCTITGEDINQGEEPDHSHTVDLGTPDHRQLRDLLLNAVAGDMPTLEECQALEWAELATSDADDNFLHVLHMFKLWHGAGFPPSNIPYNKDLDRHIMQAMQQISADIRHLVRSQVQHVEAGQYMVDMIDLLESMIEMAIVYLGCRIECAVIHLLGMPRPSDWPAEWYENLCLDMKELDHLILVTVSWESFCPLLPACFHAYLQCQEDQAQFQDEVQQIPLSTFWMIDQISHFIPNWMTRSPNKYAGFVFPWWVDRSPQYHAEFQQMRGTRIFPIAHEYFQHTWPLQQLSMGDWIDEWMEENVNAYMITVRSAAGEIEQNLWAIDHLFSWWFALSRLLGFQDA
ncbi:hypothetical protein EDD17DRAFT_1764432 [Pisolithus thermaeus]|nr:hypothetical protein EV401DRAFT_2080117 [Pisolithus croceorrhizus]KAI6156277.1 hypothetical protein EDD17DRAFT_1764432 [Pisolithus thermaeus]